jgi:signal transduction histidine kinase
MSLLATSLRSFNDLGLTAQTAAAGLLGGLSVMAAIWALSGTGLSAVHWSPLAWAAGAGALGATLFSALTGRRAGQALTDIADAAHVLRRDDAPDELELPLREQTHELHLASVNLRRMLDAARKRQRALEDRNLALERHLAARTHELSTLQDLSIGLAEPSDVKGLVDEALGALGQTMNYTSASLWARGEREAGGHVMLLGYRTDAEPSPSDTQGLTGMRLSKANLQRYEQIEREREALIENRVRQSLFSWLWSKVSDDARSSELYRASRSWMAVPLRYQDAVLGVMRVDHREPDYFDAEKARLLTAVSSQTALALRHAQLQEQQREVAVTAERNRIARELHDAVSQTLFAANVLAGTLARSAEREPPLTAHEVATKATMLERLNRGALAEMRLLMFELRPDALPRTPLVELLRHVVEALSCRGDIEVEARLAESDQLPAAVRVQLYRIAQEALSNVARHSGARYCCIDWVTSGPGEALLSIRDNGAGFDADVPRPGHFGLENMRSRAQEVGADLVIISAPGQGSEVRVTWKEIPK